MNTTELLTWNTFKNKLEQHPELVLQFQYAADQFVDAAYHITEIKQAPIVSVDCGGVMNAWTEIIVQLWEPSTKETERAMQVKKALSIIALVEKSLPLNPNAIVKIEFGNSAFDTRQMYPAAFQIEGDSLTIDLSPDFTQCKAIGRGESCGTSEKKPALVMMNLPVDGNSCTPGSNCC